MAAKIKEVRAFRTTYLNQITETYEVARSALEETSLRSLFARRYTRIATIYEKFHETQARLDALMSGQADADFDVEDAVRKKADEMFYSIEDAYFTLFPNESQISNSSTSNHNQHGIRLPKISLKTFDGKFSNWTPFIQCFNTAIHNNNAMSNIDKFQYLLSCLTGEPLNMVKALVLSDENYPVAYNLLTDRYENKRKLASHYWNQINSLKKLQSESASGLRSLLDKFRENRSALLALKISSNMEDFLWFNLLLDKIDFQTHKFFETTVRSFKNEIPTFSQLEQFIESQCHILESVTNISFDRRVQPNNKPHSIKFEKPSRAVFLTETNKNKSRIESCLNCKGEHVIHKCPQFLEKNPHDRFGVIKANKLCINCLKSNHSSSACPSSGTCHVCRAKHHTLLHFEQKPATSTNVSSPREESRASSSNSVTLTTVAPLGGDVLLATALIKLTDSHGSYKTARAVLDSASQGSFITEKCFRELGARYTPYKLREWTHLSHLTLADPQFAAPNGVDILLGADVYARLLKPGVVHSSKCNEPSAINTIFGYVVTGPTTSRPSQTFASLFTSLNDELHKTLKQFWEIEELPKKCPPSEEELIVENHYTSTVSRNAMGRYIVSLPLKGVCLEFPQSREIALHRLHLLEKRLVRDPRLRENYNEFMSEYENSGHMSLATASNSYNNNCFIPHHCVLKPESSTTKLRVVFDASCNGLSLNDALYAGPKLLPDIVSVLLKFRIHPVVFIADIKQMYRQILVDNDHREFKKILWRSSPDEPVKEYFLNTVAYGITSSPFLAIRTLTQLAKDEGSNFPQAANVLEKDTYVYDIVSGCDTVANALALQNQLIELLSRGGFELRKWASNRPELISHLDLNLRQEPMLFDEECKTVVKILGLQWDPASDVFTFLVNANVEHNCSKRIILSQIARIFDPLGFLAPIILYAKGLIQSLWCLGIDWDETPPQHIGENWHQYMNELHVIGKLKLPRQLLAVDCTSIQLHGFCDASEVGYAAVVYIRTEFSDDVQIQLALAKTKVSPLKKRSLPQLELCAVHLLSNVITTILECYRDHLNFSSVFAWTDSTIVLAWLQFPPHRWKTFVANRVSHIQERVHPSCWHHVRSNDNPADCGSRGVLPRELLNHDLWWSGPSWLFHSFDKWPMKRPSDLPDDNVIVNQEERKVVLMSVVTIQSFDHLINNISSYRKICRVIAFMLRFIFNCRNSHGKHTGVIAIYEIQRAQLTLVKHVQNIVFHEDIRKLVKNEPCSKQLRKLNPFLNQDGVLRVGGRLRHSMLEFDSKYPCLLPQSHRLTELIIEAYHQENLHPGRQTLYFLLRQQFWILSDRKAILRCTSRCNQCFRTKPVAKIPIMGDLPAARISQVKTFSKVGVDFAGPFSVTMTRHRGGKTHKAYICIFVCFATKAVHVELVSTLSAEGFLAALRRFVARRGRCSDIYSDCGTNFVGANNMLQSYCTSASSSLNINWHFNPPSSPHFGGLFEAGVKSIKTHLYRVVGKQILTYEELNTVIIQIEALLNSRPLCAISSDPNDITALTPGHFLTLEPLTAPPDESLSEVNQNRLTRWQLLKRLHQDFWDRWHKEYLHSLQQRNKWNRSSEPIEIGKLALIKSDNVPPMEWKLGRIIKLHPGHDGTTRVVTIRTQTGTFKRPVAKICPLPTQ